jgi:type I restriction enzyme, R subunit
LFVNGIPLVVIELKNPADENATLLQHTNNWKPIKQPFRDYSPTMECWLSPTDWRPKQVPFLPDSAVLWPGKPADGRAEASPFVSQLEIMLSGMLNHRNDARSGRHFIVFEKNKKEDLKTGLITIETVKNWPDITNIMLSIKRWKAR